MSRRTLKLLLVGFLVVNLFILWIGLSHRTKELRVTFLDVGQGDACVIESPSGAVLLIDAGGVSLESQEDEGRRTIAPFLRSRGINHIDALILTHPHADHIGGAKTLLDQFSVGALIDNGQDPENPIVSPILASAIKHHATYQKAERGMELDFKDGVKARILAPTPTECETESPNNASVVLSLTYGNTRFLFTGDAEQFEEEDLERSGEKFDAQVLKVGHHGSHTSTTPRFLSTVHPNFAVISVGAHNRHGHPAPEVIERLQQSGVTTFRTDRTGAVVCHSDGVQLRFETVRK